MLGAGLIVAASPAIVTNALTPTYEEFVEAAAAINNNSLLSVEMITREALRVLHRNYKFMNAIDRDYVPFGGTLKVRLP